MLIKTWVHVHHVRNTHSIFDQIDQMQVHLVFIGKLVNLDADRFTIISHTDQ